MNIIFGIGLTILLVVFVFYPIVQWLDHILFSHNMENRVTEYKLFAAKLALTEYLMIQIVNAERAQLSLAPIPEQAVIDQFKGIGPWTSLKLRCQAIVNDALRTIKSVSLK